jgi:NAD(P)-dependent dehydrogenase (short-subunit alcohol dehydrogenase family)
MKHEIPPMLERGGGSIVNMASRAGDSANPNMFTYAATKHGVVGMTRSAALDFATRNIRVNALCPGLTDTPMLTKACEGSGMTDLDSIVKAIIPMQRLARAEEQAEAAVWLCSDRSSYVTGTTLIVDGGMSAKN